MQSIKELNLKANHNLYWLTEITNATVCNLSKNSIWKQITTSGNLKIRGENCMQSIKELNLKANHNSNGTLCSTRKTVCNLSKNSIWKQITTYLIHLSFLFRLYAIYQRTQSESKSQHKCYVDITTNNCMQSIKELNLKANHNKLCQPSPKPETVCNLSKNSIWKQITT